jgi:hypothetical protein
MNLSGLSTWIITSVEVRKKLRKNWSLSSRRRRPKVAWNRSEKEARRLYPDGALRIAAQGILDKPDGGHRIIHDGTRCSLE